MSLSREDYDEIIHRQSAGKLAILIDVSSWRQLLVKADGAKLTALAGRPVDRWLAVIRVLSLSNLPAIVLAAVLAIPTFGWWSLGVLPATVLIGLGYKSRASLGKQRVGFVASFAVVAAGIAVVHPWGAWVHRYLLFLAVTLLMIRLLYVLTNVFVFRLIYGSYEFFDRFYMHPEEALLPLIWTDPEYSPNTSSV